MIATMLAVGGAVGGIILLIIALRGRRIDEHPLCRKCGFDLIGKPSQSTRCSECGAELGAAKAVRVGHRRRRGGLALAAILLLVAAGAWGSRSAYVQLGRVDWIRHRPVTWLLRDTMSGTVAVRDAAWEELRRRLNADDLSARQINGVVERALAMQGSQSTTPLPTWTEFVITAGEKGLLERSLAERYVRQGTKTQLQTRPKIHRQGPAFVDYSEEFTFGCSLVGRTTTVLCLDSVVIKQWDNRYEPGATRALVMGEMCHFLLDLNTPDVARLPDGIHRLKATTTFDISLTAPFAAGPFLFSSETATSVELVSTDPAVDGPPWDGEVISRDVPLSKGPRPATRPD